jgi:hypothetical protein
MFSLLNFINFLVVLTGEASYDLDLIAKQLLGDLTHQFHHVVRVLMLPALGWVVVKAE